MKTTIKISADTIAAVAKWASADHDRPHLRMVMFARGECVATDGHRLVIVPITYDGPRFGVDRADLLAAVAVHRELRADLDLEIALDGKKAKITIGYHRVLTVPACDASAYPPYRMLVDGSGKGSKSIEGHSFNPAYMAGIDEINRTMPAVAGVRITGWGDDKRDPVVFENTAGARFIIMPTVWPEESGKKGRRR